MAATGVNIIRLRKKAGLSVADLQMIFWLLQTLIKRKGAYIYGILIIMNLSL